MHVCAMFVLNREFCPLNFKYSMLGFMLPSSVCCFANQFFTSEQILRESCEYWRLVCWPNCENVENWNSTNAGIIRPATE